jgi:hypothetical protein
MTDARTENPPVSPDLSNWGGRPAGWASNQHRQQITFATPEPIGSFMVATVDRAFGLGMTPASGMVRWGDSGSALQGRRFAGDLGALQDFRGAAFVGKAKTVLHRPNVAYPSTAGPVNSVLDLLGTATKGTG